MSLADVIPLRRHRPVAVPYRPRVVAMTTPTDPGLHAEIGLLGANGAITGRCSGMIRRALVCTDGEIHEARIGALIALSYEYPSVVGPPLLVLRRALMEIAPGYTEPGWLRLLNLARKLRELHGAGDPGSATRGSLAEQRRVAAVLATETDPDGAA